MANPIKSETEEQDLNATLNWAQRLERVFSIGIMRCLRCRGTLRVIADVTDPVTIKNILDHVAQPPPTGRHH